MVTSHLTASRELLSQGRAATAATQEREQNRPQYCSALCCYCPYFYAINNKDISHFELSQPHSFTEFTGTGEVAGTITVENTLRSAVGWLSEISRQAGTGCDNSLVPALREWSTGVSQAGVDRNRRSRRSHSH